MRAQQKSIRTKTAAPGRTKRPGPHPVGATGGGGGKITTVVIFFMENHTTDNVASDVPGVNGNPALPLSTDVVSPDPPHDHEHWMVRKTAPPAGARRERFNAAMLPNLYKLMNAFTICDNYFSDYAGNSFPNHCFAIGADAEWAYRNPGKHYAPSLLTPGVPKRLVDAGKTWANYGNGFAFKQYKDPMMHKSVKSSAQFMIDAKAGNLPNVSWVYAPQGQDFHPGTGTSMGASDAWLGNAVSSIRQGPGWSSAMVFITFDDWGGWDDHVAPPATETFPPGTLYAGDPYRFGSRVPCTVVGPYAKPRHVSHDQLSHVSLVAFIERLWNLKPSPNANAARRTAADLAMADCYDLSQPPLNPLHVP